MAHLAIHISTRGEKVVAQPRDAFGRFLSPVSPKSAPATSFHLTMNGKVTEVKVVGRKKK